MSYDTALADRVTDALTARRIAFTTKAMFGGLCYMVQDKMCLGILQQRLMVRLDPADEAASLQRLGTHPMDFTGRPMRGYLFVDPLGYESEPNLKHWLDAALAFNPKAKASKKRLAKD
jgi:TfoX/Sxy family transcriptional regulator of competence genes